MTNKDQADEAYDKAIDEAIAKAIAEAIDKADAYANAKGIAGCYRDEESYVEAAKAREVCVEAITKAAMAHAKALIAASGGKVEE